MRDNIDILKQPEFLFDNENPDKLLSETLGGLNTGAVGGVVLTFLSPERAGYVSAAMAGGKVALFPRGGARPDTDPDVRAMAENKIVTEGPPARGSALRKIVSRCYGEPGAALCAPIRVDGAAVGAAALILPAGRRPRRGEAERFQAEVDKRAVSFYLISKLLPWQRKMAHLLSMYQISLLINTSFELEIILESALHTATVITGAQAASLLLIGEDTHDLHFRFATGDKSEEIKRYTLPLGQGIAGWVALHGKPVFVPDVAADSRFDPSISRSLGFGTKSILCVPVRAKDRLLGSLEVINKAAPGESFDWMDMASLSAIASQAAVAIDNSRLYHEAMTDSLTGLYSRRCFEDYYLREMSRAKRNKSPLSILMLDVDNFKQVNDTHGHHVGDRALKTVAAAIRKNLRESDIAARWGGEEFVALLRDTDKQGAMTVAERIRERAKEGRVRYKDASVALTCSIGVAAFPEDTRDKDELIFLADNALYDAKESGKNKVAPARK